MKGRDFLNKLQARVELDKLLLVDCPGACLFIVEGNAGSETDNVWKLDSIAFSKVGADSLDQSSSQIRIKETDFEDFLSGEFNLQSGLVEGQVKISGDTDRIMYCSQFLLKAKNELR